MQKDLEACGFAFVRLIANCYLLSAYFSKIFRESAWADRFWFGDWQTAKAIWHFAYAWYREKRGAVKRQNLSLSGLGRILLM
jgi:hypothetical protein